MFEFDEVKSRSNYDKHGIDFIAIQELWNEGALEIPAKVSDEPRFLAIGKISGKYWSCVFTYRGENIRVISARRSRREEISLYERETIR